MNARVSVKVIYYETNVPRGDVLKVTHIQIAKFQRDLKDFLWQAKT